jgi:hypothetical protein
LRVGRERRELGIDIGGKGGSELLLIKEEKPILRRQNRRTGAPGGGSAIRVATDSPASGAKAAM